MPECLFDEREGKLRDDVGGEFRTDGFEKQITLLVIEILVERREVGVVHILRNGDDGRLVAKYKGFLESVECHDFLFLRHARKVAAGRARGKRISFRKFSGGCRSSRVSGGLRSSAHTEPRFFSGAHVLRPVRAPC